MNRLDNRRRAYALVARASQARDDDDRAGAEHHLRGALSMFAALEDGAATSRVLVSLAQLHLIEGDFGAAVELGRQAMELLPGDVDALIVLGYGQWLSGSPADAEVTFGQALRRDPWAWRALSGRGQARIELRDYRNGLTDLDRAIEAGIVTDDEAYVRSARAVALAGLGRFPEAETEITAALKREHGRARVALRASWVTVLAGRFDDVEDELRRIAASETSHPSISREARRLLAEHSA